MALTCLEHGGCQEWPGDHAMGLRVNKEESWGLPGTAAGRHLLRHLQRVGKAVHLTDGEMGAQRGRAGCPGRPATQHLDTVGGRAQDASPGVTRALKRDDRVSPMRPALRHRPLEGALAPPLSPSHGGGSQGSERWCHSLKATEQSGGQTLSATEPQGQCALRPSDAGTRRSQV